MDFLKTKKNKLFINNLDLKKITVKRETPFYLYSLDQIRTNISKIISSFQKVSPLICFAIKANSNIQLIKELKKKQCRRRCSINW